MVVLFVVCLLVSCCVGISPITTTSVGSSNPSIGLDPSPLILSKYLPNNPKIARYLSQVKVTGYHYNSYSGFITVNSTTNSNMFFWFFEAEVNPEDAPVVMWLQGGPGASSLYAVFTENGPFRVSADLSLITDPYRWTQYFNMLYLDNPVGVGFSFTSSSQGFVKNEDDVGNNIVNFLGQFFQIFPDFSLNPFYIAGESYGGKYTPSAAYAIHFANRQPNAKKVNLVGISIGDGLVDPAIQIQGYADLALQIDLCDQMEYLVIKDYEARIQSAIKEGRTADGFNIFDEFLNGDFYPYPTYFYNITGDANYFNLNDPNYPPNPYKDFLNLNSTRNALHVGAVPFWDYNSTVERFLINDWMYSVKPKVELLLQQNYKVMFYNGQDDIILAGPRVLELCLNLQWSGQKAFQIAPKSIWRVHPSDSIPAGYATNYKNLWRVIVKGAGHMVPADQPRSALDMMLRFYHDLPFDSLAH